MLIHLITIKMFCMFFNMLMSERTLNGDKEVALSTMNLLLLVSKKV